ncbi:transposase [Candidatus Pacearchaeota archaeon]|nr:transposase [Candidatus Pacearchaeota archaeon]
MSSYIFFRLCPALRKRYPDGHFWTEGYFCASCGSDFERALRYIKDQEIHHGFA